MAKARKAEKREAEKREAKRRRLYERVEPFGQGMLAGVSERERSHNPYVIDSGAHQEWLAGFDHAEEDWRRVCAGLAAGAART